MTGPLFRSARHEAMRTVGVKLTWRQRVGRWVRNLWRQA